MSEVRYVRVYVRETKAGPLAMGARDVFVVNEDSVYPAVFDLPNMAVSLLMPEDFSGAKNKELTPAMAKSVLEVLKRKRPNNPPYEVEDAIAQITQYATHIASTQVVQQRQRIRVRPGAEPTAPVAPVQRVRQRARPVAVPEPVVEAKPRVRVRR